ncbi:MAG: bifunctional (p)ppGpp synthetase/guanosine-3',5'-bis(diphosphate) 3'-pyrophosphohydrolase [Prevotellaceae bacterium]|nr:bifunctional (p)ppGpp synthetase/guanosine-3',5'-bis(diphosphate) 3'-pyrophosphohydrolase [Prevotellaceae bacterium]
MKTSPDSASPLPLAEATPCTPAEYVARLNQTTEALFERLSARFDEEEITLLRKAYALARTAHEGQFRKGGEPYIMHPVAVATIIAEDFMMDANSVAAGFLHDVVEDTDTTIDDIRREFGDDVAFLVQVVTKPKSHAPGQADLAKQENNFRQLLDSMRRDIRAVLIKLADRLHNMRSLGSMQPVKQMKIAGETDFFYAPFANRLGLNNLRRELENLSFRFRCPERYERLRRALDADRAEQSERLERLTARIRRLLSEEGIEVRTEVRYRLPYSIDRSMRDTGRDVTHVEHRYVVRVIYDRARLTPLLESVPDKTICLRIYGILTAEFREKAGSLVNYVDHPKENGYRSMHVQLLGEMGTWEEIHISSEEMVRRTKLGIMLERIGNRRADGDVRDANRLLERGDREWIDKFCVMLERIAEGEGDIHFMEGVADALYAEDITVYDAAGTPTRLPQHATALDCAFERGVGEKAHYARIDGRLASLVTPLEHGNCVEIFTAEQTRPCAEWTDAVKTFKAKNFLKAYFRREASAGPCRCPECLPLPGQEVIGFTDETCENTVTVHRRDCPRAISLSAQHGDAIVEVEFPDHPDVTYPVATRIRAVDRPRLLHDIIASLTDGLGLEMNELHVATRNHIVELTVHYAVHSVGELRSAVRFLGAIESVDEVRKI